MARWAVVSLVVALSITSAAPVQAAAKKKVYARYVTDSSPFGQHPDEPLQGPWRLGLQDGRLIRLDDAVFASYRSEPALTPHGSQVAYYRKPDGRWVIRDLTTGKVRRVPGRFLSDGAFCQLSPGGRFLVLCGDTYQIVDSYTGQAHKLSGGHGPVSFSPDNAYVLHHYNLDPHILSQDFGVTEVYDTRTWAVVRHGKRFGALAMGGRVVATMKDHSMYIQFWDVSTGWPTRRPVKVPEGETARALMWDRAGNLDVLTEVHRKYSKGFVVRERAHRWRRVTDKMRILDTFRITKANRGDVSRGAFS